MYQNKKEVAFLIKLESVKGFRGNFYDTNGENLTQNLTFYRIGVHPKKVLNIDRNCIHTPPHLKRPGSKGSLSDPVQSSELWHRQKFQ